jgi:hypothetical protein
MHACIRHVDIITTIHKPNIFTNFGPSDEYESNLEQAMQPKYGTNCRLHLKHTEVRLFHNQMFGYTLQMI